MLVVAFWRQHDLHRVRQRPPPSRHLWVPAVPLSLPPLIPYSYITPCPSSPFPFTANTTHFPTLPSILTHIRPVLCTIRLHFPFQPHKMACIIPPTLSQPRPLCPLRILSRAVVIIRACIPMLAHIIGIISRTPSDRFQSIPSYYFIVDRALCLSCCYLNIISCIPIESSIYFITSLSL